MNKPHTQFTFKEIDPEGLETLQAIADANGFNGWMYERVKALMNPGEVLEIGSGIGNISKFFLAEGWNICLSDLRDNYLGFLAEEFSGEAGLSGIRNLDLVHPEFDTRYADLFARFDNVFALNVIEHIEDDQLALINAAKLLRPGGKLVILVPAFQSLYNGFDRALFHFRRYTRYSLTQVFNIAGLTAIDSSYFNAVGIAGWWFSGVVLRKKTIPPGQMRLFNLLVPVFKWVDKLLSSRLGLSVIAVGVRKEGV